MLQRLVPTLLTRDMERCLAFYESLGFSVVGVDPNREAATWAAVEYGDVVLQFYTNAPLGMPTEPILSGTFYLRVDDVDSIARRWRESVKFLWGPEKMSYGTYEFGIEDPSGYHLAVFDYVTHGDAVT